MKLSTNGNNCLCGGTLIEVVLSETWGSREGQTVTECKECGEMFDFENMKLITEQRRLIDEQAERIIFVEEQIISMKKQHEILKERYRKQQERKIEMIRNDYLIGIDAISLLLQTLTTCHDGYDNTLTHSTRNQLAAAAFSALRRVRVKVEEKIPFADYEYEY